ncbi:Holliday junction resolvase RuvX [Corynebacterium sp. TAE3-ERU12]|uniref:Holliday junction resolvase RuvX n=1 Tax=Corynebacterium sp. TAE3-ERU12 TaxID=2849491 RepID=UPI001C443C97|nr:Holliday junction resolvase RuvX [Corynebacterium sp. TAE3-ERU12]MBV7295373.1 Holliday junction resolvase RuvX [Corynebacterium sp. TAE3-ERU12]
MAQLLPDRPGADDPGRGRRLGIDVGEARIGVAISDPDGLLATPVETIRKESGRRGPDGADVDRLVDLIEENEIVEIIIGLPLMLDGGLGSSARTAEKLRSRLRRRTDNTVPVRMQDERMTTVIAASRMREAGVDAKSGRSRIDQAAAVEILQSWLDARKDVAALSHDSDAPDVTEM